LAYRLDPSATKHKKAANSQSLNGTIGPHLERLNHALKGRLGLQPEDLHALIKIGDAEAGEQLSCTVRERLLRHFEVRKGLRIDQETRSRRMLSLASFANFLCDEYSRSGDLRCLSTALKVNESLYRQLRWLKWCWISGEAHEIRRLTAHSFVAQEQLLGALDL